jgi:hypothetical protein
MLLNYLIKLSTIFTSCLLLMFGLWSQAHAVLTVTPTRAVFENNTRSMEVKLTNDSDKKTTFRISFKNLRMTEEGDFEVIDSSKTEGRYADKMVRFSPRQITLDAGAAQSVRLLVRKPKGLADGEYRSHLLFQEVPDTAGLDLNRILSTQQNDGVGAVLVPISGITIPVIVRQGKLSAEAKLTDLGFKNGDKDNPPTVAFHMHRSGNKSVHGDLEVTHFAPGASEGVVVGLAQGTSVLAPTSKRETAMQLDVPPGHKLKGGRLAIVYREAGEKKGVLAEVEIALP